MFTEQEDRLRVEFLGQQISIINFPLTG